jgi:hypothetical protein
MTAYSKHFTREELACPTSGQLILQPGFIEALEALREAYDRPMSVTSGCRSGDHNDWLISRGYQASRGVSISSVTKHMAPIRARWISRYRPVPISGD